MKRPIRKEYSDNVDGDFCFISAQDKYIDELQMQIRILKAQAEVKDNGLLGDVSGCVANLNNGDKVLINGGILSYENGVLRLEPNDIQKASGTKFEISIIE